MKFYYLFSTAKIIFYIMLCVIFSFACLAITPEIADVITDTDIGDVNPSEAVVMSENIDMQMPEEEVTLIEALRAISRLHSMYYGNPLSNGVPDEIVIEYSLNHNICDEEEIGYDRIIQRYEIATIICRAFPDEMLEKVNNITSLSDVSAEEEYFSDVLKLYNAGVISGIDEYGTFFANGFLKRYELFDIIDKIASKSERTYGFVPTEDNRLEAAYLIEDESMTRTVRRVRYIASGWSFDNPMVFAQTNSDYSYNSFSDISETQKACIKKEIKTVTNGTIVFECEYTTTAVGSCVSFESLDGELLFELVNPDEFFYVNTDTLHNTGISFFNGTAVIRIFMDMDTRLAKVYINGQFGGIYEMTDVKDLSRVIIGTTEEATLHISINSVFMYQNFYVNDDFRMDFVGSEPLNWDFSENVSLVSMNCDSDIITAEISNTGVAKREFDNVTDKFVAESYVRISENQSARFVLMNGNEVAISVDAKNGVFSTGDTLLRNYTPGVWQQIRIEVDTEHDFAIFKINGKKCAELPFVSDSVDCIMFTADGNGAFNFDDVKVFNVYDYADYCPVPVPVNDDEWYSGMSICSLWREGSHYGWDCISPYEDLTPVIGYYDEGIPEAMDWEIKMMVEHGYDYQRFCWYYGGFNENIKKPRLCDDAIHDGYFNAKYSDMLDFSLMWENAGSNGTKEEFYNNIWPYWVDWYLTDERYFCIDNKPVLTIYSFDSFRKIMGDDESTKECIEFMRNECIKLGYSGMIIYVSIGNVTETTSEMLKELGVDSAAAYHFDEPACDIEYQKSRMLSNQRADGTHFTPSCGIGFNDIGWTETRTPLASEDDFEKLLIWTKNIYLPFYENEFGNSWKSKSIMTNTWNEFGEGHYVMPTSLNGFGYMDAHRHVFSSVSQTDDSLHYDVMPTIRQKERLSYLYTARRIPLRKLQYDDGLNGDSQLYSTVVSWNFETRNDCYLWGPLAKTTDPVFDETHKAMFGTTITNDGHIRTLNFVENKFSADNIKYLHVCMMTDAVGASNAQLYFKTSIDDVYASERGTNFTILADGQFHDYYVDMSKVATWKGNIIELRFDPLNVAGDYYIKSIEFLKCNDEDRLNINIDSMPIYVLPGYFEIDGDTVYTAGNPTSGFYSAQQFYYEWNRKSGKFYLKTNNGTEFEFVVGSNKAKVNGTNYTLEREISLIDGLVVIPLSFVYEKAGYEYSFENENTINVKIIDQKIAEALAERKDFQYEFNIPGDNENWYINCASGGVSGGYYVLDAKFNGSRYDPQINIKSYMDSRYSNKATVRIKADFADNSSKDTSVTIYFTTSVDGNANEAKSVRCYLSDYICDSEGFYLLTYDFTTNKYWNNNITSFRLDPPNRAGTYYVDYIRFEPEDSYLEELEKTDERETLYSLAAEYARLGKPFYVMNADAESEMDTSFYENGICTVTIVDDDLRQGNKAFLVSTKETNSLVWSYLVIPTRFNIGTKYKVEFDMRLVGDIYGNEASNVSFCPNFRYSQIQEDGTLKALVEHSVSTIEGGTLSTSDGWKHFTVTHTVAEDSPTRTNDKFSIYVTPKEKDGVFYNYEFMVDNIVVHVADNYFEFNKSSDINNWNISNAEGSISNGCLNFRSLVSPSGTYDPNIFISNLSIDAARFNKIRVRVKSDVSKELENGAYAIYFTTESDKNFSESKTVKVLPESFSKDNEGYCILEFDMTKNKLWRGNIEKLRFDTQNCAGTFSIDYIYVDIE